MKLPKIETGEKRFLSPHEVEDLAEAIESRFRVLVLAGAYTGLRFGELAALRRNDIDPLRLTLRVDEQLSRQGSSRIVSGPPKTSKALRTIGLPEFLASELVGHIADYPSSSDLVFSLPQGGLLDYNRFRTRYWNPAVRISVGPSCTPHDLRHTHVAILIAQGESPKYIADRLGHESTRTVFDVYGHLYEGVDQAASSRLDDLRIRSLTESSHSNPQIVDLPTREARTHAT